MKDLYIKAVNPGYKVDGKNNVGEMIEIGRISGSDEPISLAGITIDYTNSSGNTTTLVEFPEQSFLTGETILLRLVSSPNSELANVNYAKTLAFSAGLTLRRGEDILDAVCWDGKDGCFEPFSSSEPTTLARNSFEEKMQHLAEYQAEFSVENYLVEIAPEEVLPAQCRGLQFSELLSYYEESQSEQFVEIYNAGAEQVLLDGCQIKYKNKYYPLSGVVEAEGYLVRMATDFRLTKNPNSSNVLEIIDVNGEVVDRLEYPNGQRKGTSYIFVGYDAAGEEIWRVTYAATPGEPNNYQEFKTCEPGKVINEETGNCVKATVVTEKVCGEGQYLNPLTGRCRKIPEVATAKTCKEGYELNPETNRCRKIKTNTGASYELTPESYTETSNFVALYVVLGVILVAVVYIVYEFRHEILKFWRKVFRRSH